MQLGIIGWINEESFKQAVERELDFLEFCVNSSDKPFLERLEETKAYSEKYHMPIASVGRWGTDRISQEGNCIEEELAIEYQLIEAAAYLGSPVYVTGCNERPELSYYENITAAIHYLEKLIAHGKVHGVKIATYNCRWNNFIHSDPAWTLVHGYLKELGMKYDTSHCIYAGGDYLAETKKWADRFYHVHIKGALVIDGVRFDDPPAGLDQTDWRSFLAALYAKGYTAGLSIEPHSEKWKDDLGQRGIDFTTKFIRELMI